MIAEMLANDERVKVIVRRKTTIRLMERCFRPRKFRCAGNFIVWESPRQLFDDALVHHEVEEQIAKLLSEDNGTHRFTIDYGSAVGWESTDHLDKYADADLEEFDINDDCWAWRVKRNRTDLKAPLTSLITFVVELRTEDNEQVVIVHSIYPGVDIGDLDGDITDREQRVFFDWKHPGE